MCRVIFVLPAWGFEGDGKAVGFFTPGFGGEKNTMRNAYSIFSEEKKSRPLRNKNDPALCAGLFLFCQLGDLNDGLNEMKEGSLEALVCPHDTVINKSDILTIKTVKIRLTILSF